MLTFLRKWEGTWLQELDCEEDVVEDVVHGRHGVTVELGC